MPGASEVNPGDSLTLPCVVEGKGGECRWEKDGGPVGLYEDKYVMAGDVGGGDCSLVILDASEEYDSGEWQCQVSASSIEDGDSLVSERAELVVRAAPESLTVQSDDGSVVAGKITGVAEEELGIQCVATGGKPAPRLAFIVADEVVGGGDQVDIRLPDGGWVSSLVFPVKVKKEWNGSIISCIASHELIVDTLETELELEVLYTPVVETVWIEESDVKEGDSVTLHCDVDSNPASHITWTRAGQDNLILSTGPRLVLHNIDHTMKGMYGCTAENSVGKSEVEMVELNYHHAPVIVGVGPSEEIIAVGGEVVTLTCLAEATPTPDYTWLHQTLSGEIQEVGEGKDLVMEGVSYADMGEYYCQASNQVRGETKEILSQPISVQVRGIPLIVSQTKQIKRLSEGEDVLVSVRFCSSPMPYISWRTEEGHILHDNHRRKFSVDEQELKESLCYVATLDINHAEAFDAGDYFLHLENEFGVTTEKISLEVVERFFSQEILIAICSGSLMTIIIFLFIVFTVCKSRIASRDVESQISGSISEAESRDNSSDELIYKRTDGRKSKLYQAVSIVDNNLEDLYNFPKSSNCGSMRIKKTREDYFNPNNLIHVNTIDYSSYVSYDDIDKQISDIL